jgi:hypothetical protein
MESPPESGRCPLRKGGRMLTKFKRAGYYAVLGVAGVLFLIQLLVGTLSANGAKILIETAALAVISSAIYISKFDRDYLISSITLRSLMCVTGLLGMVVVVTLMAR